MHSPNPKVYTGNGMNINLNVNNSGAIVTGDYNTLKIETNRATVKVTGNYYRNINLDENNSGVDVTGNYNSIKIENNRATLTISGNYYKIRVARGNGPIRFTGNYCFISIGPSMDQNQVTCIGKYIELCRESDNSW